MPKKIYNDRQENALKFLASSLSFGTQNSTQNHPRKYLCGVPSYFFTLQRYSYIVDIPTYYVFSVIEDYSDSVHYLVSNMTSSHISNAVCVVSMKVLASEMTEETMGT